ncbi:hypothetical protein J2847_000947 [Azospirillum agricola]|uniref:S41 family peptidase n=1 Tax=Azospirillum agricola TaxID=1720247 RepID=UPI001AEACF63|nr:S41 family peptidase [Azospirillum agricola]MBP2227665.1 hypothetical protein [Azospirillum agricola]
MLGAVVGALLLGALGPAPPAGAESRPAEVRALLEEHYVRSPPPRGHDGLDRGIAAALAAIDPLIAISDGMVRPEEERAERRAVSLGVTLVEDRRGLLLVPRRAAIRRLPEAARLLAIGGTPVRSMGEAVKRLGDPRLRGPVEFTLRRDDEREGAPFRVALPVSSQPGPALESWTAGDAIVIRIHAFVVGETEWQVAEAIRRAPGKRVVLDLRYCPGGSPFSAFAVAGLFFPAGDTLGHLETRDGDGAIIAGQDPEAPAAGLRTPVTVLVGAATASAAEIAALLLASGGRAAVVGETTFGKCVILRRFDLATGGDLSLPVAEVTGRNRERCHHAGITPTHAAPPERRHADALIADLPAILAGLPRDPVPEPIPAKAAPVGAPPESGARRTAGNGVAIGFGAFGRDGNARTRQEQVRAALLAVGEKREVRIVPAPGGGTPGRSALRQVVIEGFADAAEADALCSRLSGVWPRGTLFECRRLGRR